MIFKLNYHGIFFIDLQKFKKKFYSLYKISIHSPSILTIFMKSIFSVLLTITTFAGSAQLKISNGSQLTLSNNQTLYVGSALDNQGTLTLNSGKLSIAGNFTNTSGTLSASNATLEMVGGNAQSLNFGANDVMKRVELNKSSSTATVASGNLNITDTFKAVAGTLNAAEKMVLVSTATKTAIVEPSTGGVVDNIVVERYIPAKRAFRLLSAPVTSSTSIRQNWQENQNNTSAAFANNSNTTPGYGTHIAGSTTGANGFDATLSGNPSLFTFSNAASPQTWNAVANTNTLNFTAGTPYRLMVRGNRSIDMSTNTPTASITTLRTRGSLKIGAHTVTDLSSTADQFNFIGNPYQSPVDIRTVLQNSTNVNSTHYYTWDPKVGGTNGRGAFVTYTFLNNSNNVSGSEVNRYLQPMQACFVTTVANGAASVTFQETNKFATTNELVYRTNNNVIPMLKLNLYDAASLSFNSTSLDGILYFFGTEFSNELDLNDAGKLNNLDENLSCVVEGKKLSIASFNMPTLSTVYPLSLSNHRHQNYVFTAQVEQYEGLTPYLFDSSLNTYTEINDAFQYSFTVNTNNPASLSETRFKIVFDNQMLNINDFNLQNMISLYPNPSNTGVFYCNIPSSLGEMDIKLYNELGQLISASQVHMGAQNYRLEVNQNIPAGIYFVEFTHANGTSTTKKWLVN